MMKDRDPVLSVITIVFNNVKDIERTMLSVFEQSYPHLQYIIVDGGSTDGTVDVIRKYESRLTEFICESDKGIYDAMNKGLALATGDYVLFMNSGDEIYDRSTVENVFSTAYGADIYYGETEMYDESGKNLGKRRHAAPNQLTWRSFRYGMSVSHQAIYVRRLLAEPYDLKYQLSSDIDWILKSLRKAGKIVNVNTYVAKYQVGGISKKKHLQSLKERFGILTKYYGLLPNIFSHVIISFKLAGYYLKYRKTND